MATKLITAPDGTLWFAGRGGYTQVKKGKKKQPTTSVGNLIIPEEEPITPPKPTHKTYKLHYTKPWEGTYGQFLNQFGNENFPHGQDHYDFSEEQLGNLYIRYSGSEATYSQVWLDRIVDGKYYAASFKFSRLLKPGTVQLKAMPTYYDYLSKKLDGIVAKGRGWPLSSKVELPPEEVKEEKKEKKEEVKVAPQKKKESRECTDPSCEWCHPSLANKPPPDPAYLPDKLKKGFVSCYLCLRVHQAFFCPSYPKMNGKWLWEKNNWKNSFCTRCGSMEHKKENCDWVAPPLCGWCGIPGHLQNACPSKNGDNKFGLAGKGSITTPPWEKRGVKIDYIEPPSENINTLWPIENMSWDPLVENARLIILEYIAGNVRHPTREAKYASMEDVDVRTIVNEAQIRLDNLVSYVEPRLRAYTDMAVGGELRHHRAIGGRILPGPSGREMAWKSWKQLRSILGSQGLLDAATLFEDFAGGGYGGVKWGIPAKILWMREVGKISGLIFLDRVFDLEHNGGAFLNKVKWKVENRHGSKFTGGRKATGYENFGIEYIKAWLGPARELDEIDWGVILFFAPYEDRILFREYWERSNRIWRQTHLPSLEVPRIYEVPYGTGYMIRLSPAQLKKKKDLVVQYFPGIHSAKSEQDCAYCGGQQVNNYGKYKYFCEDGLCPAPGFWPQDVGLGSPTFCNDHFTRCMSCGLLLCQFHEYNYCHKCQPPKPVKSSLNSKYYAYKKGSKK